MGFFADKLGPVPTDMTPQQAERIKAALAKKDAAAAAESAQTRAALEAKAQEVAAKLRGAPPQNAQGSQSPTPTPPADAKKEKKKGWF